MARERLLAWAVPAAVAGLAFALFAGALDHGFTFDDRPIVERQPELRSVRNFTRIVTRDWWDNLDYDRLWRPLTLLSYAAEASAWGVPAAGPPDPRPHHLGNVVLHAVVSVLVYALGRGLGLGRPAAAAGGALFAALGVHVEPVANIVGRAELLATLFTLLALAGHRRAGPGGAAAATAGFALGLLSKESAIAFLAWAPLADGLLARRPRWRRYAVYLLVLAAYLGARYAVLGSLTRPTGGLAIDNPIAEASWWSGRLTAVAVLGRYAWALVWPAGLAPCYGFDEIPLATTPFGPWVLAGLASHGGLLAAAVWLWRRAPRFAFAALAYLTALFPVSNLALTIGTVRGDRLLYLPSVGLAVAVAVAAAALARTAPRALAAAVVVAAVGYQGVLAVRAVPVWRDDLTLFTYAEQVAPRSAVGLTSLALARLEAGETGGALAAMRRAAAIADFNLKTLHQVGEMELRHGSRQAARAAFRRAVELEPGDYVAWNYLGSMRFEDGDRSDALDAFRRAAELKPGYAPYHNNRARTLLALGREAEALQAFEQAIAANPRFVAALQAAAQLYARRGDIGKAQALIQRAQKAVRSSGDAPSR